MRTFTPLNSLYVAGGQSHARKTAEGYRNRSHYVDTKNKVGLQSEVTAPLAAPDVSCRVALATEITAAPRVVKSAY